MSAVDPVVAIAQRQHGVVKDVQLAALGLSRWGLSRRVRSGLLDCPYPGVYRMAAGARSWRQQLMAACLWGGDTLPEHWPQRATAVVSYEAAAALLELEGFGEGPVVLTGLRQARFHGSEITVHRGKPDRRFTVLRDGIPVTNVPRTLVDLAQVVPHAVLERTMDDALRQHLVRLPALRWTLQTLLAPGRVAARDSGRRGAQIIVAILDGRTPLDGPSASAFQKDVRALLRSGGLRIREEQVVLTSDGAFVARVDFELECDIVVEAQSAKYHSSWEAQESDLHRHNR